MSLEEFAENQRTQLANLLDNAVETISNHQQITFTLYVRMVLPIDGFVFWVNSELVDDEKLSQLGDSIERKQTIDGSLHRQVTSRQEESESRDENYIIFTPVEQCDYFNINNPAAIYIGEYAGEKFTFSRMDSRYTQAGIWHLRGLAVLPTMLSQLIETKEDIAYAQIVSSSLPAWLTLDKYAEVFPAYLVPNNFTGKYIAIDCSRPRALQSAPLIIGNRRYQLVSETVRATLQQFNNYEALNWLDYVLTESLGGELFGISNIPVVEDGRAKQVELKVLDQSKVIVFEVNYYQQAMTDKARILIKEAFINIEVNDVSDRND